MSAQMLNGRLGISSASSSVVLRMVLGGPPCWPVLEWPDLLAWLACTETAGEECCGVWGWGPASSGLSLRVLLGAERLLLCVF